MDLEWIDILAPAWILIIIVGCIIMYYNAKRLDERDNTPPDHWKNNDPRYYWDGKKRRFRKW